MFNKIREYGLEALNFVMCGQNLCIGCWTVQRHMSVYRCLYL